MNSEAERNIARRAWDTAREKDVETAIAEEFIPATDDVEWRDKYQPDQEHVNKAQRELAAEYRSVTTYAVTIPFVLIVLLFGIDVLMYLNAQVYGLVIGLWGATLMVYPDLKGRFVIATISEGNTDAQRQLAVRNMAFSNAAFALIAAGFLLQIGAVQVLPGSELVPFNILPFVLPQWTAVAVFGVVCALLLKYT